MKTRWNNPLAWVIAYGLFSWLLLFDLTRGLQLTPDLLARVQKTGDIEAPRYLSSYFIAWLVGFLALALSLLHLERFGRLPPKIRVALLIVLLCQIPLLASTPPQTSVDFFYYLGYGRKFAGLHLNPYDGGLGAFRSDPVISQVPIGWLRMPSLYGPVAILIYAIPHLFLDGLIPLFFGLKAIWSIAFLGLVWVTWQLLRELRHPHPVFATFGLYFNPIILWMLLVDGHVELLLLLWLTGFLWAYARRLWFAAGLLLGAACATKAPTLVLLIPLGIQLGRRHGASAVGKFASGFALLCFPLYAAFRGAELPPLFGIAVSEAHKLSIGRSSLVPLLLKSTGGLFSIQAADSLLFQRISNVLFGLGWGWLSLRLYRRPHALSPSSVVSGTFLLMYLCLSYYQPWYALWSLPFLMLESRTLGQSSLSLFAFLYLFAETVFEIRGSGLYLSWLVILVTPILVHLFAGAEAGQRPSELASL